MTGPGFRHTHQSLEATLSTTCNCQDPAPARTPAWSHEQCQGSPGLRRQHQSHLPTRIPGSSPLPQYARGQATQLLSALVSSSIKGEFAHSFNTFFLIINLTDGAWGIEQNRKQETKIPAFKDLLSTNSDYPGCYYHHLRQKPRLQIVAVCKLETSASL